VKFDPAKAASARCVLLKGTDGILVGQALSEVLQLHKASADATPESFSADSRPPSDWLGLVSSASFFSDLQVVVVRSVGRTNPAKIWSAKEGKAHPFAQELLGLPDFARLILVAEEEMGTPERAAAVKDAGEKWGKLVEAGGGYVASLEVDAKDTAALIEKTAKERGLSLSKSAAQKLSLMTGGQAGLALAELEKASIYVHPRKDIRESDLDQVVVPEPDYNIFQLAEAIVRGEPGKALKELAVATDVPPASLPGEAIGRILPAIHRQVKLVWQARVCIEARCSPSDPPEQVLKTFPDRPALHKERDWVQQKSMTLAQGVNLKALSVCLKELASADARLKGVLPSFSAKETLESMVLAMSDACHRRR
jgi:DNA polymerase III delta subunit